VKVQLALPAKAADAKAAAKSSAAAAVAKSQGSSNPYNMVRATFNALKREDSPRSVAARRTIKVSTLQSRRGGGVDADAVDS